jgi:glycosyltransferase involved in cell wall biosynthesis
VLIVNFNYSTYIGAAIDSVLSQSYPNYEIVVCDDGSTDDSREVILRYATAQPSIVRPIFKENGGVASALNAAFAAAGGDIIALLDADDLFAPQKLVRIVHAFTSRRGVGLVVNRMTKLKASGDMTGLIPQFGKLDRGWLRDKVLAAGGHWSFAPSSGISLSRDCANGLFPIPEEQFRTEADSFIYTQAPLFWEVAAIDEPLSTLRLHTDNITSTERMDSAYARRVTASIKRMCNALDATARANNLPRPHIEHNPVYGEMIFIGDYLERRAFGVVLKDLRGLWRAALRCRTEDRGKVLSKPFVLSVVALLPHEIGNRVLQGIYAPSRLRATIAQLLVKRLRSVPLPEKASAGRG